jgi:hypothetical protein
VDGSPPKPESQPEIAMHRLKIPPQILRLVLLTLGIVGSYFIARAFLTPPSFGDYGWYRGDALEEIASHNPVHAGRKACEECHSEIFPKLAKGPHKTISCETCHGVSRDHAENPDIKAGIVKDHVTGLDVKPAATADMGGTNAVLSAGRFTGVHCIRCHESNPSRPAWFKQIVVKTHYAGKCTECHLPHQPTEVP